MSVESLNVNSLQLHFDEIQCMTNELGIHVLALNKTKLNPHVPKNLIAIEGYQVERKDRTSNGGGVAIYIRNSIKYHLFLFNYKYLQYIITFNYTYSNYYTTLQVRYHGERKTMTTPWPMKKTRNVKLAYNYTTND